MNLASIKAVALDVDGVLTDGGVWWSATGDEWKRFCFADVMGVSLAIKAGLIIALISGEDSPIVDRFAAKFRLTDVVKGCKNKASALADFASRHNLSSRDVCFMGDDVNDLEAMKSAGLAAAPADSHQSVRDAAAYVTRSGGGRGAVRELIDAILAARCA